MKTPKLLLTLSLSLLASAQGFAEEKTCVNEMMTENGITVSVIASKVVATYVCADVKASSLHAALETCSNTQKETFLCKWHNDSRSVSNVSLSVKEDGVYEVILTKLGPK